MDVKYTYKCWQDDSIIPNTATKPYDGFFAELRIYHNFWKLADRDSDAGNNDVRLGSFRTPFFLDHDVFLAKEELGSLMLTFLNFAYIPDDSVKGSIIDEVHRFAHSMLNEDKNVGLKILPIVVEVGISMLQIPEESEDEGITRAMRVMDVYDCVPATKASVRALERVAFDGLGSVKECLFCSETLSVGAEVTRMPCSHVYHRECLVSWLEACRMCPICRFCMPC